MRWTVALLVTTLFVGAAEAGPRISEAQAAKIAVARIPGTVVHQKLKKGKAKKHEHDHWNVKIAPREHAKSGTVRKVEIDAETGAILKIKDVKAKSED